MYNTYLAVLKWASFFHKTGGRFQKKRGVTSAIVHLRFLGNNLFFSFHMFYILPWREPLFFLHSSAICLFFIYTQNKIKRWRLHRGASMQGSSSSSCLSLSRVVVRACVHWTSNLCLMLWLTFACMCICSQRWHLLTQPQSMRANYPHAIIRAATSVVCALRISFATIIAYARIPYVLLTASVFTSNAAASHADG